MTTSRVRFSLRVPPVLSEDDMVVLGFLRDAMQATGWTYDALIAELKRVGVNIPDRQYVGKMVKGEKPISLRQIVAFPDDLEADFLRRWCQHKGLIVVTPVTEDEARLQLATGLFSLLTARALPNKVGVTAKADLRSALPRVATGGAR